MTALRRGAGIFAEFLIPSRCPSCGRDASPSGCLCFRCESALAMHEGDCAVCGGTVVNGTCPDCGDRKVYYDRSLSLYRYEAAARRMIAALKSGNSPELGRFLGERSADRFGSRALPDIITFVPVSKKRRRERGYNQAELIARSLGRRLGVPVRELLFSFGAGNQKRMHYHERFLNMLGRFGDDGNGDFVGRSVLLVDDVFTTGSTVNECARVLKKMGVASVFSLTVARVDNKKVDV